MITKLYSKRMKFGNHKFASLTHKEWMWQQKAHKNLWNLLTTTITITGRSLRCLVTLLRRVMRAPVMYSRSQTRGKNYNRLIKFIRKKSHSFLPLLKLRPMTRIRIRITLMPSKGPLLYFKKALNSSIFNNLLKQVLKRLLNIFQMSNIETNKVQHN